MGLEPRENSHEWGLRDNESRCIAKSLGVFGEDEPLSQTIFLQHLTRQLLPGKGMSRVAAHEESNSPSPQGSMTRGRVYHHRLLRARSYFNSHTCLLRRASSARLLQRLVRTLCSWPRSRLGRSMRWIGTWVDGAETNFPSPKGIFLGETVYQIYTQARTCFNSHTCVLCRKSSARSLQRSVRT